jgi:glycosyltransferase involved in cell wall biosynthesis
LRVSGVSRPGVLLLRGHQATPWGLRPWEELDDRFDVACVVTGSQRYEVDSVRLERRRARAMRDYLPPGVVGDVLAALPGDRYFDLDQHLDGVAIVHAEELSYWFAAEAARRKEAFGYALVLTVWETLPLLAAYRNRHARRHRERTLPAVDLFLAATERARDALLLEGVDPERIEVCPPGIDVVRFAAARERPAPSEHRVLSAGRLVWEKGHHDLLRAVAALRRGIVPSAAPPPKVLIVGSGPEEGRLRGHAAELGIGDLVDIRSVPYADMPAVFADASCMVLASLASAGCSMLTGPPHCFWEEQFGLVLAEAMAAGLPIVTSGSGAIREVAGDSATYFSAGDWRELARALAEGPLARSPGERSPGDPELIERYSVGAYAARLAAAYERLL